MELRDFLKKKNIRQAEFASKVGIYQSSLSMIINGARRPSPDLAMRIQRATGGKVTVMELLYGADGDRCEDAA